MHLHLFPVQGAKIMFRFSLHTIAFETGFQLSMSVAALAGWLRSMVVLHFFFVELWNAVGCLLISSLQWSSVCTQLKVSLLSTDIRDLKLLLSDYLLWQGFQGQAVGFSECGTGFCERQRRNAKRNIIIFVMLCKKATGCYYGVFNRITSGIGLIVKWILQTQGVLLGLCNVPSVLAVTTPHLLFGQQLSS